MIRLLFCGDFKCDNVSALNIGANLCDLIAQNDIRILNFEAPIKSKDAIPIEKNGPNIYNDSHAPAFLTQSGFNLFSLANNHIYDFGSESLMKTIKSFPVGYTVGAGNWEDAYQPVIMEVENKKVGFLAVTHHEFGVLYEQSYCEQEVGAAWMLHPIIDEIVIDTKKKCDYLFIISHCGLEHEYYPMPEVRTLYRHWINIGADGVIASHAHTPQPWEMYNGKPIAYNLGNFCFDVLHGQIPQKYWYWSLMSCISIENNTIQLEMKYCYYDQERHVIELKDDNSCFNDHIDKIMEIFQNESLYINYVNKQCVKYEKMYERLPMMGGFYRLNLNVVLRQLVKFIIRKKNNYKITPLQNIFKCETHRWAISRILDNKYNNGQTK